jgi:hypothetical protein
MSKAIHLGNSLIAGLALAIATFHGDPPPEPPGESASSAATSSGEAPRPEPVKSAETDSKRLQLQSQLEAAQDELAVQESELNEFYTYAALDMQEPGSLLKDIAEDLREGKPPSKSRLSYLQRKGFLEWSMPLAILHAKSQGITDDAVQIDGDPDFETVYARIGRLSDDEILIASMGYFELKQGRLGRADWMLSRGLAVPTIQRLLKETARRKGFVDTDAALFGFAPRRDEARERVERIQRELARGSESPPE